MSTASCHSHSYWKFLFEEELYKLSNVFFFFLEKSTYIPSNYHTINNSPETTKILSIYPKHKNDLTIFSIKQKYSYKFNLKKKKLFKKKKRDIFNFLKNENFNFFFFFLKKIFIL
jgi:hypothetical protein